MRRYLVSLGAVVLASAFAAPASAQERQESYLAQHLRAPSNALELKVGAGYTQGFGNLAPGRRMVDASGAGIAPSLDVDWRVDRKWSVGLESQYQEFTPENNTSARGLAFNGGVTYHFDPVLRGDPWLRLGTGYRLFWENDVPGNVGVTTLRHGFQFLTAKVGYDVRVSEDVAIAPVVGGDLSVFFFEDRSDHVPTMQSGQVAPFVYAGMQGRFDIGGERSRGVAQAPPPEPLGVTAPQPQSPIAPSPPPPPVEEPLVTPSLAVSEDIVRACRIHLDAVEKAPKFDFDKSDLLPADYGVLQQIGECFATGPLKDKGVILVGRADPRGSVAYNQALGMRRANGVASFLERYGIEGSRIVKTSRGKLDARGRDEVGWAQDRRVDVMEQP